MDGLTGPCSPVLSGWCLPFAVWMAVAVGAIVGFSPVLSMIAEQSAAATGRFSRLPSALGYCCLAASGPFHLHLILVWPLIGRPTQEHGDTGPRLADPAKGTLGNLNIALQTAGAAEKQECGRPHEAVQ